MIDNDPTPPVADDDFPEFSEPPRQAPPVDRAARESRAAKEADGAQKDVDALIERLRRERAEGKR